VTGGGPSDEELLADQIRYYEARAPVYEQLYFLRGTHATEDEAFARSWRGETSTLERFVERLDESGEVLELACGNGLWTRLLAPGSGRLTAIDSSMRMLSRNREWIADPRVRYVRADLFTLELDGRFDLVFAGFFLSHIPPTRWQPFWAKVARWLAPGGTIAFVDDAWGPDRPRSGDRVPGGPGHAHVRRLEGSSFTIVKRFFRPDTLVEAFGEAGFDADVSTTGAHFLFGTARRVRRASAMSRG
jgi:demethylmenaquinone methyltransferase/2-methoxy-6-polyprenyl-1,4-benzoquinol methylase